MSAIRATGAHRSSWRPELTDRSLTDLRVGIQSEASNAGVRGWNPARIVPYTPALAGKSETLAGEPGKEMQQKVLIACALLHEPLLYLIDEPTVGLDLQAQR